MMKAKERKADKLLFVLSVDTEEEFDWEGGFPQENCSVDNIRYLPEFHQFCESLNITIIIQNFARIFDIGWDSKILPTWYWFPWGANH